MKIIVKTAILFCSVFFMNFQTDVLAHPAWGIVADKSGRIYFSDLETIYIIDRAGKLSIFRAGTSGRHIHNLSIDADENVYGYENVYEPQTEKHLRAVWKMSPGGEYTEIISLTDKMPLGMSIWRDFEGNTYSVEPYNNEKLESKIIKRAPDGKTSFLAGGKYGFLDGKKDEAQLGSITDMAFGRDGAIYVTEGNRLRKIDRAGNVKTIYPNQISAGGRQNADVSSQFFGLESDNENNVLAADFANRRVLKISSDGAVSTLLTSEKDWSPIGVTTFETAIYVLEGRPVSASAHGGTRVLKISSGGQSATIVASLEGKNIRAENSLSNGVEVFSQNDGKENLIANANQSDFQTAANSFGFYGILGAASVGCFALIILFRKK